MKPSAGSKGWFESAWRNTRRALRAPFPRDPEAGESPPDYAVVHIAVTDDVAAACGRIDAAERQHAAVVVPDAARKLRGPVPLARVRRHAYTRGKSLVIVSASRAVRAEAREARLRAFGSLAAVRFEAATRRRLFAFRAGRIGFDMYQPSIRGAAALAVAALAATSGACAAYLVVPSTDVTLYPRTEPFAMTLALAADPSADELELGALSILPAERVETRLPVRLVAPTTGTATVGVSRASGEVVFTNDGDAAITIPAGTVLRSEDGASFGTTETVTVDAAGEAESAAEALASGSGGNAPAGTITEIIEGPPGVAVTNPGEFEGGEDEDVPAVAEADHENARALAALALRQDGAAKLAQQEAARFLLLPGTETPRLETEHFDRVVGEPGQFVTISGDGVLAGVAVRFDDLEKLAELAVALARGPDAMLLPDAIEYRVEGEPSVDAGSGVITVLVVVTGSVGSRIDTDAVERAIAGMNETEATAYLATQFQLALPPEIDISPGWLSGISRFDWRVDVRVRAAPPEPPIPDASPSAPGDAGPTATTTPEDDEA